MGKEHGAKVPEREPVALCAEPFADEYVVARRLRASFDGAQDNRHMSLFQRPAVLATKL
jgi:hypothetical protein